MLYFGILTFRLFNIIQLIVGVRLVLQGYIEKDNRVILYWNDWNNRYYSLLRYVYHCWGYYETLGLTCPNIFEFFTFSFKYLQP